MVDLREIEEIGNIKCPKCGIYLDGASDSHGVGATPKPGDISICYYCGTFLVFNLVDEKLSLRKLTDEEFDALPEESRAELLRMKKLIREHKKNKPN